MKISAGRWVCLVLLAVVVNPPAAVADRFLTLASTTSTRDSGFFDAVLPPFEAKTGIQVRVVAVGTGRALRLGERGDVDAVLVHDRASELEFVAEGHGIARRVVDAHHKHRSERGPDHLQLRHHDSGRRGIRLRQ